MAISLAAGPAVGSAAAATVEGTWEIPNDSTNRPAGCALYTPLECTALYAGADTLDIVDKGGTLSGKMKSGYDVIGPVGGTESAGKVRIVVAGEGGYLFQSYEFIGTLSTDGSSMSGACPGLVFHGPCFEWSGGVSESRHFPWDAVRVGALAPSTTTVQCSGAGATCTAKVGDASGEQSPRTPTGSVTFSATAVSGTAGSFKEPVCELKTSATAGTAECSASYTKPASASGQVKVSAAYGGDAQFAASSSSVTLCADGADLDLESVRWVGRHDNGFEIDKEAILKGCGLAAGDVVQWGNDEAKETLDSADVGADGMSATTTVPWSATTGKVSVTDGQTTVTLNEDQAVDSWRNNQGFSFNNFESAIYPYEMVKAFPATQITDPKTEAVLAPYQKFFKQRGKEPGRCYGFAYLSSTLANGAFPVDRFGEVKAPYQLTQTGALTEEIDVDWWKQFADETDPYLERGLKNKSGADIRSQLDAAFGTNGYYNPAIVSINWWTADDNLLGHALTAFAVRDTPTAADPGQFTIYAYDSNTPFHAVEDTDGAEHIAGQALSNIIVHGNGSWYDARLKAGGTPIMLHVTPIAAIEGALHLTFKGHVSTVVSAETRVESVTDPATGKPVALEDGGASDVALVAEQDGGPIAKRAAAGPGRGGVAEIYGPEGRWTGTFSTPAGRSRRASSPAVLRGRSKRAPGMTASSLIPPERA